jgi:hypothetical protein
VYTDSDAVWLRFGWLTERETIVRRPVEMVISVVAVSVLLTGCSSASQSGQTSSTVGGRSVASASPSDPNAGLKNGTQLKASLLTTKDLPAGFKVSPDLVRDSADGFGPLSTATASPTRSACKKLHTNVWIDGAGIGSASFAQTSFADSYSEEIDAEIDAFRGTDAQGVMTNLRKLFAACSKFKTTTPGIGHHTVKVVAKAGPRVGDDSIKAVLTSSAWQGGMTLVAVRVGNVVVSVLISWNKSDLGAKATNLAETMVKRL